MSIDKFEIISRVFGGKKIDADKEKDLFKETLIMTLSRMTRADFTVEPAEVDAVIGFVKEATGAELSEPTIRVAASSELFETTPLEKQLKKVVKHLSVPHRVTIAKGLAKIIGSDERVTDTEIEFYNSIVNALNLTPAHIVGMDSGK